MLVCSMWALSSWRHITGMSAALGIARPMGTPRRRRNRSRGRAPQPGLMERLEERWRRRQERGG
jgi:hypothetical protein